MMCARCVSIVRTLASSRAAICLVVLPSTTSFITCRSRGVSRARRPCIVARSAFAGEPPPRLGLGSSGRPPPLEDSPPPLFSARPVGISTCSFKGDESMRIGVEAHTGPTLVGSPGHSLGLYVVRRPPAPLREHKTHFRDRIRALVGLDQIPRYNYLDLESLDGGELDHRFLKLRVRL